MKKEEPKLYLVIVNFVDEFGNEFDLGEEE